MFEGKFEMYIFKELQIFQTDPLCFQCTILFLHGPDH